jgi:hypothetical protein
MAIYQPVVVMQLADVLHEVSRNLRERNGQAMNPEVTDLIAKRIVALFDSGVTDAKQLKSEALAMFTPAKRKQP